VLIWAALRFGPRATSAATLVVTGSAVAGTLLGRGVFADGTPREALMAAQIFMGMVAGTVAILGAVTAERNRAEDALRQARASLEATVERRTAELQSLLAQKNVLLQEVHHRVKNNLQVVSSVLHMQSRQIQDPGLRTALQDSEDRVRAIALVHEKLYDARDLASIDVRRYLESLGAGLVRAASGPTKVALDFDGADLMLGIDTAIPCGLIVNELISNALKHAFPGRASGRIAVRIHKNERISLDVADDGVGFPPTMDFRSTPTLGLRLVSSLTQQLGGTIELDRSQGTCFQIRLPRELARSR
jgi:two-component sensor histidine kinase